MDSSQPNTSLIEAEARSRDTPIERLRELSGNHLLRHLIAMNPSIDEQLMWDLAWDQAKTVVSNPRFEAHTLENTQWWIGVDVAGLSSVLDALSDKAPDQAKDYLFATIASLIEKASPITINREWHITGSQFVSIQWQQEDASITLDDEDETGECEDAFADFKVCYHGLVEENTSSLVPSRPPKDAQELLATLVALYPGEDSSSVDVEALERLGWTEENQETGDNCDFWVEDVQPDAYDCSINVDLSWIEVVDPAGNTHQIGRDQEMDGNEFIKPTLCDSPLHIRKGVNVGKELVPLLLRLWPG
jgi:hypothetical protein